MRIIKFNRKFRVRQKQVDNKTVFVPIYREWYSWRWHSLLTYEDDYCETFEDAVICLSKIILARVISDQTGKEISPNELPDPKPISEVIEAIEKET